MNFCKKEFVISFLCASPWSFCYKNGFAKPFLYCKYCNFSEMLYKEKLRRNNRHFDKLSAGTFMRLATVLKNVGLTEIEARIYLGLLELGEANLKDISDKISVPRTSIYAPIKILLEKGIVEFYERRGRKYYLASSPERVLELHKTNIHALEERLEDFKEFTGVTNAKPKIRFFEGREGVKLVLNEILEEKRFFSATTSIENMNKVASDYFENFIEERIKRNLKVRLLTNRSAESQSMKNSDDVALRETRFVPQGYRFDTANYIFGDKVAILSIKKEPVTALLIEDREIAETQRMYFDLIWKMASSV